jgi:hypothetical protein
MSMRGPSHPPSFLDGPAKKFEHQGQVGHIRNIPHHKHHNQNPFSRSIHSFHLPSQRSLSWNQSWSNSPKSKTSTSPRSLQRQRTMPFLPRMMMSTRTQVRPYLSPGCAREFCIANIGASHQQPLPFEISALANCQHSPSSRPASARRRKQAPWPSECCHPPQWHQV